MDDGVYFGLPFEAYLAEPRFSSHGVGQMSRSPYDFWARSWMNPNPVDEESEFKDKGTAYHTRVVEGREKFMKLYAPELDKEAFAGRDLLVTMDDMKSVLRRFGLPLGGNKPDLVDRVRAVDPGALIWDSLIEDHAHIHRGKKLLPMKWIKEMEIAAANIENHPDLKQCFSGGYPEVSVFWTDEVEAGGGEIIPVKMKSRFDYVKPKAWLDLKSFGNVQGMRMKRAVAREFANRRYYVQVATYYRAADRARDLAQAGKVAGIDAGAALKLLTPDKTCIFVWQQTVVPVALGRIYPRALQAVQIGEIELRDAQEAFARCVSTYGADPWVDQSPIEEADDNEFPAYLGEG